MSDLVTLNRPLHYMQNMLFFFFLMISNLLIINVYNLLIINVVNLDTFI